MHRRDPQRFILLVSWELCTGDGELRAKYALGCWRAIVTWSVSKKARSLGPGQSRHPGQVHSSRMGFAWRQGLRREG